MTPHDAIRSISDSNESIRQLQIDAGRRMRKAAEAQIELPRLLSGEATWAALHRALDGLASKAPKDHDVLIEAFGIHVLDAHFMEPHTFLFEGYDGSGNQTGLVCHFTQLIARVVYLPKRGAERVITGFGK